MAKLWLLLFVVLVCPLWASAEGLTCGNLFFSKDIEEEGHQFIRYALGRIRTEHQFDRLEVQARPVQDYHSHLERFEKAIIHYATELKELRDHIENLKDNQTAPISENRLRNNENNFYNALRRMKFENTGIIARTSDFLSAIGVNHTLNRVVSNRDDYKSDTFYITIDSRGDHFINRKAREMKNKYNIEIVFDTAKLLEVTADGMVNSAKDKINIILDPSIMISDSRIQNSIALHEFFHAITKHLLLQGDIKTYHAEITLEKGSDSLRKAMGIYSQFGVDELPAYRMSIRTMAHHAITKTYMEGATDYFISLIKNQVETEIILSEVTNKVFHALIREGRGSSVVYVDGAKFRVTMPYGADVRKTAEMAEFNEMLYKIIQSKLESSDLDTGGKIKTLKQIVRVLTLPAVRKLDGNYPSRDEIIRLLN